MENTVLVHHGIRGMKWGVRRYQNKDGSLTPVGKKKYNAEMAKLKEEAKVLKNKQATQAKLDKLDAMKQKVQAMKDAEKNEKLESKKIKQAEKDEVKKNKQAEKDELKKAKEKETLDAKKKRVLDSHDPEELYKNKDIFDYNELQAAYLRLNTERNIKNMIPEKVNKGKKFIEIYVNTGKTVKDVVDQSESLYKSYEKGKKLMQTLAEKAEKAE